MSTALARLRIVLSHPTHPGNIGAAARAMHTMGLSRLYLVNPRYFPDPAADARASGATAVLAGALVHATLDEALSGSVVAIGLSARRREFVGSVLPIRAAAAEALRYAARGDVAIVFGTEMSGLSNAEILRCQILAMIPANPHYSSLNLAAAVQIAAYELRMASEEEEVPPAPVFAPATQDEIERLYAHGERTLTAMRFLKTERPRRLMPRLRRLFARARLEKEEVNILRGILTRVDELFADKGSGE